jgi:hypothetical protein
MDINFIAILDCSYEFGHRSCGFVSMHSPVHNNQGINTLERKGNIDEERMAFISE